MERLGHFLKAMRFTLKYTTLTDTSPPNTINDVSSFSPSPQLTPFPITGKFRCRISGYEFSCLFLHQCRLMKVVSRELINPLQPDALLYFIPTSCSTTTPSGVVEQKIARVFSKNHGWWEVDLRNEMDLIVYPADEILTSYLPIPPSIPAFTFLMHLELEPII